MTCCPRWLVIETNHGYQTAADALVQTDTSCERTGMQDEWALSLRCKDSTTSRVDHNTHSLATQLGCFCLHRTDLTVHMLTSNLRIVMSCHPTCSWLTLFLNCRACLVYCDMQRVAKAYRAPSARSLHPPKCMHLNGKPLTLVVHIQPAFAKPDCSLGKASPRGISVF